MILHGNNSKVKPWVRSGNSVGVVVILKRSNLHKHPLISLHFIQFMWAKGLIGELDD